MGPEEREQRLTELVEWVDWLVDTYELRNQVARCWYQHPRLVELFSALFIGWVRTYVGDPTKLSTRVELDWIKELYALLPPQQRQLPSRSRRAASGDVLDAQGLRRLARRDGAPVPRRSCSHPAQTQATKLARVKRLENAAKAKAKEAGAGRSG